MPEGAFIQPVEIDGVLTLTPPRAEPAPLVFDSPHSGLTLPDDFRPSVDPAMVLHAADTHVDALFDHVPDIGAALLTAHFPRSFMDLNRSLLDMDVGLVEGGWPDRVRDNAAAKRGMGLIWRYAWGDVPMYAKPLTVAEVTARIDRYWRPYHDILGRLIETLHRRFGVSWHIDCHSMPARGHKLSPDPEGRPRADFVLGDRHGRSCDPALTAHVATILRELGYDVALNDPFAGAELVTAFSAPERGRHSLQIEVNRRLYMDETTRARSEGFLCLHTDLCRLAEALRAFVKAHG